MPWPFLSLLDPKAKLHRYSECRRQKCSWPAAADKFLVQHYLERCKDDSTAMANLRRLVAAELPGNPSRTTNEEVIRQAADRLQSGRWHIDTGASDPAQARAEAAAKALQSVGGTQTSSQLNRKTWPARLGPQSRPLRVVRAVDLRSGDVVWTDSPLTSARLLVWAQEPEGRQDLVEMCRQVDGEWMANVVKNETGLLAQRIDAAFRRGLLVLVPDEKPSGGGADASSQGQAQSAPPAPPKPVEKTWFRMQLLDEDGSPMAGEDYDVVDSDGAHRRGKLDSNGELYIPPVLTPGDCTIKFPNIHLNPRKRT